MDTLPDVYVLKQLPYGAITRVYPAPFTLWLSDPDSPDGYKEEPERVFGDKMPLDEEMEAIFLGEEAEEANLGFLDQLADFVQGMQSL